MKESKNNIEKDLVKQFPDIDIDWQTPLLIIIYKLHKKMFMRNMKYNKG